jgi:DNA-binding transcriptional MerR regulator
MLSIGELSRITQLTVKALRLYHEKGLLIPDQIDYDSRYRYYGRSAIEKARRIKRLKDLGFSLGEIKQIILECTDDKQLADVVAAKIDEIDNNIKRFNNVKQNLMQFRQQMNENESTVSSQADIQDEIIEPMLVCGIRFRGRYPEVGRYIGDLFKKVGRFSVGKPYSLYYDGEYKEDGADIESCVQVRKEIDIDDIHCRELPGGRALTVIHKGPYETLGDSYGKLFGYLRENELSTILPIREQYLKGPGIIFRGDPQKYLTRLMVFYR